MKLLNNKLLYPLLLCLLILGFLNRGLSSNQVFFQADEIASDLLHFAYPYHQYWADEYLHKGKFMEWNQYLDSGLPILAEAQVGILYPPAIILYLLFPDPLAFNLLIISSVLLLGLGMYWFALEVGLLPLSAFYASVLFSFSGYMVARIRHVPILTSLVFLPFALVVTERLIKTYRMRYTLYLAILVALSFFAGHLTTTYAAVFIVVVNFFLRLFLDFKERKKESLKPILFFLGGLFLGLCLAAIQILPSLELIGYSTRSATQFTEAISPVYKLSYLLMFLNPTIFGDPSSGTWNIGQGSYWENIGYVGISALFLALVALVFYWKRKQRLIILFGGMTVIALLLVLGQNTPIFHLLWEGFPGFGFLRIPGRFLFAVVMFLSLLAAFGLQALFSHLKKRQKGIVTLGIFSLTLIDLWGFGYSFTNVIPASYFSPPSSVKFLKKDATLFRIRSLETSFAFWQKAWSKEHGWRNGVTSYMKQRVYLEPDLNLAFLLASPSIIYELSGHFVVKKSAELDNLLLDISHESPDKVAGLLAMENVKYILSPTKISLPHLTLAYSDSSQPDFPVYIYKNTKWLERAYFVGKAIPFSDTQSLTEVIASSGFSPTQEVLLQAISKNIDTQGKGKVTIRSYQDEEVHLSVTSDKGGYVVLSDTYYPGWHAYVDAKEVPILQANYAYRAVEVTKGTHTVQFVYKPLSVKLGILISIGTGILLLLSTGFYLWKRKSLS